MALDINIEIQNLLRSSAVQDINFKLGNILITGQGFSALSNCFSDKSIPRRIRVTVNPRIVGDALATYTPHNDKIHLRSRLALETVSGRATLIHECTHAQVDLRRTNTNIREEEAAGFIAAAWYYFGTNNVAIAQKKLPAEIITITSSLYLQRDSQTKSKKGVIALTRDQIDTAKAAMRSAGYRAGRYTSNGIRGLRYPGDKKPKAATASP